MNEIMQTLEQMQADIRQINTKFDLLKKGSAETFKDNWIDGQDVLFALNISKRTLQSLRDKGILPFSRIKGKFYYKVSDINSLLEKNYSGKPLKSFDHEL